MWAQCSFLMTSTCFQVNIQVPPPDQQSDKIAITGLASHLDRAKEGLFERVKELQAEQAERVCICSSFKSFCFSPFHKMQHKTGIIFLVLHLNFNVISNGTYYAKFKFCTSKTGVFFGNEFMFSFFYVWKINVSKTSQL